MTVQERDRPPRRVWSPWPIVATALAVLVLLAVLVRNTALRLELWLLTLAVGAVLVRLMIRVSQHLEDAADEERYGVVDPQAIAAPRSPEVVLPTPPAMSAPMTAATETAGQIVAHSAPATPATIVSLKTLTADEVAKALRMPIGTVINGIRDGALPGNGLTVRWLRDSRRGRRRNGTMIAGSAPW